MRCNRFPLSLTVFPGSVVNLTFIATYNKYKQIVVSVARLSTIDLVSKKAKYL